MKNSLLFLMAICFFTLASFDSLTKHYGGSASASAKCQDANCHRHEGGSRVISVTVSCRYLEVSSAKGALKDQIETHRAGCEKLTTSISYDIDSCE